MSKIKGTKRKSASLSKTDEKLPVIKIEPGTLEDNNHENIKSNTNPTPAIQKSSCSKYEGLAGSCNDPAVNTNADPCDAFSSYMKNAILEEVLNAKKAALLQSPEVIKLLRDEQLKKQKRN